MDLRDSFESLYQITCELTASLDLGRVLDRALDRVIELTQAERGMILLRDESGERLECARARNMRQQALEDPDEMSVSILEEVMRERRPVWTSNALEDPRFAMQSSVLRYRLRSLICTPLIAHDEVLGVVYVDNRLKVAQFGETELEFLTAFANIAAIAISNARLHQDLRRSMTDQRQLVDRLHQQEMLRARAEQASESKTQAVQFVSHEIMQPLTAMRSFLRSAARRDETGRFTIAERKEIYGLIRVQCERIHRVCSDMLDLSLLESGRALNLQCEPVELKSLLEEVARAEASMHGTDHRFHLDFPEGAVVVTADPEKLTQAFHNLLNNAVKYMPMGGQITIRMRTGEHRITVEVEDHGVGIPGEQLERLFQPFERTDQVRSLRIPGHGVGLFLTRRIVEAHGGTVVVRSEIGKGTVFTVEMPVKAEEV